MLLGCQVPCDQPVDFGTRTYRVFANLVEYAVEYQAVQRNPPDASPLNGATRWTLGWEPSGPTLLTIDDQVFEVAGTWATEGCRTFDLRFDGIYTSDGGVRHVLDLEGTFFFYDDVLEGELRGSDRWDYGETSGTFTVDRAVLYGERLTP